MTSEPPEDLIERFVAGDEGAYARVVETHQAAALAYAAALLNDSDLAADAVQEAFIDAHARRGELRDRAAFAGWLRAIVRTRVGRIRRQPAPAPLPEDLVAPGAGPEAALAWRQERQTLAIAVADLPEHERVAVHLFYVAGCSV